MSKESVSNGNKAKKTVKVVIATLAIAISAVFAVGFITLSLPWAVIYCGVLCRPTPPTPTGTNVNIRRTDGSVYTQLNSGALVVLASNDAFAYALRTNSVDYWAEVVYSTGSTGHVSIGYANTVSVDEDDFIQQSFLSFKNFSKSYIFALNPLGHFLHMRRVYWTS